MRKKLAATCEALIALLDEIDGDENLGETADDEPLLGWPNGERKPTAEMSCDDDREHDDCDLETSHDDEHELAWQDEGGQASLQRSFDDGEAEFGTTEEIDQVRRLETSAGWLCEDGEPDLGFVGHATGWREGEDNQDREACQLGDDEREYDPGESGIADADALQSSEVCLGGWSGDGYGHKIANKLLSGEQQDQDARPVVLFRREDADSADMPRFMWHDQWTCNLPPEAFEVLIPEISMHRRGGVRHERQPKRRRKA